jgi:hypothetical protein
MYVVETVGGAWTAPIKLATNARMENCRDIVLIVDIEDFSYRKCVQRLLVLFASNSISSLPDQVIFILSFTPLSE